MFEKIQEDAGKDLLKRLFRDNNVFPSRESIDSELVQINQEKKEWSGHDLAINAERIELADMHIKMLQGDKQDTPFYELVVEKHVKDKATHDLIGLLWKEDPQIVIEAIDEMIR